MKSCPTVKRKASGNLTITSLPGFVTSYGSDSESRKLSVAEKSELADAVVNMCAKDIRPFSVVDGIGFRALATMLVALGAKHGCIDIDDALPSERTVSRHVEKVAAKSKENLKDDLMKQWRLAVTCDMWTYETTNTPYITVTSHHINDCWELCACVLATRAMEERKTSANIKLVVFNILEEFGADRHNNFYVTDNGANVKAAFHDQTWISCCGVWTQH